MRNWTKIKNARFDRNEVVAYQKGKYDYKEETTWHVWIDLQRNSFEIECENEAESDKIIDSLDTCFKHEQLME